MQVTPWLWWIRRDLRLEDNPALCWAASAGTVIPVYIHTAGDGGLHAPWQVGEASSWWLHHSLSSLQARLHAIGSRMVIRTGDPATTLATLVRETGAAGVAWNRLLEPAHMAIEQRLVDTLQAQSTTTHIGQADLIHEPADLLTGAGTGYRVFTPFWRTLRRQDMPPEPVAQPQILAPDQWPASVSLASLGLLHSHNWADGLAAAWTPGEIGAQDRLRNFAEEVSSYEDQRNLPAKTGTSSLSPHLHFGEVSPRQAWWVALEAAGDRAEPWLRQLAWREFAHHLLWHEPATIERPLRPAFEHFPWSPDPALQRAWQRGQTGYPLVDAGMRQLWHTGWMHNRVRMVVASFLVKDLLQPWQDGARWFWNTLVDADLANNTMGWQWTAGCGADAAPFFRIFNPTAQGKRFDPLGQYVRHWVPEISGLSDRWIHEPWRAPDGELATAGVSLGESYPRPIVDHSRARKQALAAYQRTKSSSSQT